MNAIVRSFVAAGAPLLLVAPVAAQEEPAEEPPAAPAPAAKREVKDGKLTDPYWGLEYGAEGLKETMGFGAGNLVFSGESAGGVEVEILVSEGPAERSAAEWSKAQREAWTKQGRKTTEVEEPEGAVPTLLFVEESLSGFKRHHGYAFHARGLTGFQVHASVRERSDTSGATIRARLGGLSLGEDTGASFLAFGIGRQAGRPPTDLKVRLDAGMGYQSDRIQNPAMSHRVLLGVLKDAKEGDLDGDGTWLLHEYLGLACLRLGKPGDGVDWLKKSEALAPKSTIEEARTGQSTYNLACAYSLAGKADLAFETLARCAKMGAWGRYWEFAQTDPDFEAVRKDPRWAALKDANKAGGK